MEILRLAHASTLTASALASSLDGEKHGTKL